MMWKICSSCQGRPGVRFGVGSFGAEASGQEHQPAAPIVSSSRFKLLPVLPGRHSRLLLKLADKIGLIGKTNDTTDVAGGDAA